MKFRIAKFAVLLLTTFCALSLWAGDAIPKIAWKRGIGEPLANPGTRKPQLNDLIDDGYWEGAPVGIAQVLLADLPKNEDLRSWKWDYPVGAGTYYALYPKSWYDYRWDKLPAHVTLEQFSPILPDNYKETSYPVAVYRWHAENPTNHRVTVSVLLSWENMLGWFRTFSRDLHGGINHGNHNVFRSEPSPRPLKNANEAAGSKGAMKGIVFDRNHLGPVQDQWDGQFVIAALESPGLE